MAGEGNRQWRGRGGDIGALLSTVPCQGTLVLCCRERFALLKRAPGSGKGYPWVR
jgi:hypothetical protein